MKKIILIVAAILCAACIKDDPTNPDVPKGYAELRLRYVDTELKSTADSVKSGEVYEWMQTLFAPDSTIQISLKRKVGAGTYESYTPVVKDGKIYVQYGSYSLTPTEGFLTDESVCGDLGTSYSGSGSYGLRTKWSKYICRYFSTPEFEVGKSEDTVDVTIKKSVISSVLVVDTTECKIDSKYKDCVVTNGKYQALIETLPYYNNNNISCYTTVSFVSNNVLCSGLIVTIYMNNSTKKGYNLADKNNAYLNLDKFYGFAVIHPFVANFVDASYEEDPAVNGVEIKP